ncbi:MAG TPA: trypsin-like peptidase domain-containing protein [Candidatus Merdibacter merdavium]|uniref:Trypsin-like peptidase domain-containing protein n=1 Tax=Candidatus Merdibacter merdavium TaxID=2838692 RepID=A0A9D2NPJ4_9FIRM|nr:trypsin-like peptidase domain-containing protein [Candidatus Merdibacter merdavium]
MTAGRVAMLIVICLVVSLIGGLGGSYIVSGMGSSSVIYRDTSGTVNATSDSSGTIKSVVEQCADAVVEIQTESISSGGSLFQQYISSGAGSGVILTQDGYIVTNHHVIENATSILVRTRSGDEYNAQLIGSDQQSDLAVLKIDASGLTPAVLGDSTKLEVGDLAVVIGNPLGELGGTVTSGIISALDREVTIDGQVMTLMQTDAAVNPGNSGGGLFDANGDLVGIINAKSSGNNVEGLGFAIPISNATDIIDELIANGEVTSRPTLGVSLYEVTDANSAAQLGVDSTGVYIVQIVQGGSADLAGLQTGDRIVSVDGTEITSADEVRAALNEHSTGDQMNMVIERNGDTIEVRVSL